MKSSTRVQILDEAARISFHAYAFRKGDESICFFLGYC